MCLWAVDFPPTSLLPPIADPPRPGQSPQRLELGKLHPGHPLQWLSTWSHIKSLGGIREIRLPGPHSRPIVPALGRLGQGIAPTARGSRCAAEVAELVRGGQGSSHPTPSCLDAMSSCFPSLWFCYKFKAKFKM